MQGVQKGECRTSGCKRVAQIKGVVVGYCCALCTVRTGMAHASLCNMIEEVGNAEVELGDNIVLGYN